MGRVEQPPPAERREGKGDHPRHKEHAAPFALAFAGQIINEVRCDQAYERFQENGGERKDCRLLHHHPENVARQQESEISKTDEPRLGLVQHRQIDRVEGRIDNKAGDDQNKWQTHQKSGCRALPKKFSKTAASRYARAGLLKRRNPCMHCICHALLRRINGRSSTVDQRRSVPANSAGTRFVLTDSKRSGAKRALKFLFRPLDDVVELLVALSELGDHHGIDGLVVHLSTDFGASRRAEHRGLLIAARWIAVNHTLRRLDCLPGIEVVHALERRQVVTDRGGDQLSYRFLLRYMQQEIFAGRLVLREAPQAVKLRKLTDEAALRTSRHRVTPDVFRNLWIVTLGNRPRTRRIHNSRTLAGNDPPIVARVVPGVDLGWVNRHELLQVFERGASFVRVDLDVVLLVDHHYAVGLEKRTDPVDSVAGLTHWQANRETRLV